MQFHPLKLRLRETWGSPQAAQVIRLPLLGHSRILSVEKKMAEKLTDKVTKSEAEWRQQLTPEQYHVTREAETEPAFTGKYWDNHEKGMYHCVGCGAPLFESETKFDSGT